MLNIHFGIAYFLLNLLHIIEFEISALQCRTHYSPAGNGDVLDIVVHKNVRLSEISVSDILDSDPRTALHKGHGHKRTSGGEEMTEGPECSNGIRD
jgi:hypothetical protein